MKILIVDDSKTETDILKAIFQSEKDIQIVGCAKNGKEAVEMAEKFKPDIITMDICMPIMNGMEATRLIMTQCPIPIVIISSYLQDKDLNASFLALEAGALSVIDKPVNITSPDFSYTKKRMVDTLRSMAEIKVIRRRFIATKHKKIPPPLKIPPLHSDYELVAIGTSIGGPQALKVILSALPADFPIPIVVVQHMTAGFMQGFTKWLNDNTPLKVKSAEHLEVLNKGTVYFAPDNFHLEVKRKNGHLIANLISSDPVSGFRPSASVLLKSVANTCGKHAIGILLTGMGSDGSLGLLELKKQHGLTLIQDAESSVVFGMAGVAQSLGAVDEIIELEQFSDYLKKITGHVQE
jgi:two-component system chemotaxis response regulator CheB